MSKKFAVLLVVVFSLSNVACSSIDSCLQDKYGISKSEVDKVYDKFIEEKRASLEANGINVDEMPVHYDTCGQR